MMTDRLKVRDFCQYIDSRSFIVDGDDKTKHTRNEYIEKYGDDIVLGIWCERKNVITLLRANEYLELLNM